MCAWLYRVKAQQQVGEAVTSSKKNSTELESKDKGKMHDHWHMIWYN